MELGFETIGNATVIAHDRVPLLVTDPWLRGPAYFGSWSLAYDIPPRQRAAALACPFVWISHAHPDHLSAESLEHFRSATLLLPDHCGGRVARELGQLGFRVRVLQDRTWVPLSERVRVFCVADYNQDAVLLIDVGGTLVIDLNDASDCGWGRGLRAEIARFDKSFLMCLSGYGDGDMFVHDEAGNRVWATSKAPFGGSIARKAESLGARFFVPFSSMHQYQRTDSLWANEFTTPVEDHRIGFESQTCEILPAYVRYDVLRDRLETIDPPALPITPVDPSAFGDDWSERLEPAEVRLVDAYFRRFEHLRSVLDFVRVRVGGEEHVVEMTRGPFRKGITFDVPRGSLVAAVTYRVFDDLLIGNFMKVTLHGSWGAGRPLYPDFTPYVAKYGDNGLAHTRQELRDYFAAYRQRFGFDYVRHCLEAEAMHRFRQIAGPETPLWAAARRVYWWMKPAPVRATGPRIALEMAPPAPATS
ncbi:MAG: hypothetical protein DCC71_24890, partial [Proteobacteria bacterium]